MTDASGSSEVRIETRGAVGLIALDRPKALNALNQPMCLAIDGALKRWADDPAVSAVVIRGEGGRAFCAGGDVRVVAEGGLAARRGESDGRLGREYFRDEYRMDRRIATFPKPYVALIDGITMGGGIGLSAHGSHRVATERTLAAMPETGIGLFPDVGASYLLPRLSGEIGTYLALTGARMNAGDLVALGIATHCVASARLTEIVDALCSADWSADATATVDTTLARFATDAGPSELLKHGATIDRCFAGNRMEDIVAALAADGSDFAKQTAATLNTVSPTSLKLTLAQMRRGKTIDLDAALVMEYRLTQSVLKHHDFYEGIRAQLIDKDRNPKWDPPTLAGVDDAWIAGYFEAPPQGDLTFPD